MLAHGGKKEDPIGISRVGKAGKPHKVESFYRAKGPLSGLRKSLRDHLRKEG